MTPSAPAQHTTLRLRYHELMRLEVDGNNLIAKSRAERVALGAWARESGLAREFAELEHPTPPPAPQWEPTTRYRVRRAFAVFGRTPYGTDLFTSAIGGVVDLPASVVTSSARTCSSGCPTRRRCAAPRCCRECSWRRRAERLQLAPAGALDVSAVLAVYLVRALTVRCRLCGFRESED